MPAVHHPVLRNLRGDFQAASDKLGHFFHAILKFPPGPWRGTWDQYGEALHALAVGLLTPNTWGGIEAPAERLQVAQGANGEAEFALVACAQNASMEFDYLATRAFNCLPSDMTPQEPLNTFSSPPYFVADYRTQWMLFVYRRLAATGSLVVRRRATELTFNRTSTSFPLSELDDRVLVAYLSVNALLASVYAIDLLLSGDALREAMDATNSQKDEPFGRKYVNEPMADTERPSPFTIPTPRFRFLEGPPANPPPLRSVTVGSLIRDLTAFADFYEAGSADMIRSGPSEKPSALGDRDSNADYVQRVFRATVAIDRVRAYVLARFGAELTIVSARRLLGDLIQRCALTVNAAEALPLEAAMDRLEAANERSNRRETTPADRFLAASRLQALNYLRLFDAVIALFESVQQDGSAEPPNSASILKAFEELTKALGIDRKQTWQENYQRLGIIQRTGKSLQWMAKGAFEFLDPTNRKGWGLGVIEHALVELWEQMNEAEKIVLDAPYQKAISIYKRLPPVLALWAKKNEPVVWGDDRKELTKEEMTQHVNVFHAYVLKDTWEVDACFSRWAEGGIEKADRDPMPVGPGFPEAELALDLSSKREVKPLPVEKHKDGPEPPHWLWFNGKRHRIGTKRSRLSWLLLEYFWARDSAIYEDLQGPGKPWLDPVTDSAVATAVNRFNNEMPAGFPWKLITKGRHVAKESGENPAK